MQLCIKASISFLCTYYQASRSNSTLDDIKKLSFKWLRVITSKQLMFFLQKQSIWIQTVSHYKYINHTHMIF